MSVQKYVIKKGSSNFTTFSNKVLQGLSNYSALGLYTYISSLAHGWVFHKDHLAKHGKIGRDQINSLLRILVDHNLIKIAQMRNEDGRFAHFELEVLDGSSFKINNVEKVKKKVAQPFTEKPLTDNQLLVNSSYKENNNKEYKEIKNISYASEDACESESSFDKFWNMYPKKKDKKRCQDKFKKLSNTVIALILVNLKRQVEEDQQWKDLRYVPYPSTYLENERWLDAIVKYSNYESINYKPINQLRSTVKEWGPGHPSYDSLHNLT